MNSINTACMDAFYSCTTVPAQSNISVLPDEVRCKYPSKRCENHRALKRSGDLHRFCEFHRAIANRNQRRLDQRRRQRQRKDRVVVTAVHHQLLSATNTKHVQPLTTLPASPASVSSGLVLPAVTMATPVWDEGLLSFESFMPTTEIPSFDDMFGPQLHSLEVMDTLDFFASDDLLVDRAF